MNITLDESEKDAIKELIESDQSSIVLKNGTTVGFVYAERMLTISIEDPRGIKCVVLGQDKRIVEFLDMKKIPFQRPKIFRVYPNSGKKLMKMVIKEYETAFGDKGRFYIEPQAFSKSGELLLGKFALMDRAPTYESNNFQDIYNEIVSSAKVCIDVEKSRK